MIGSHLSDKTLSLDRSAICKCFPLMFMVVLMIHQRDLAAGCIPRQNEAFSLLALLQQRRHRERINRGTARLTITLIGCFDASDAFKLEREIKTDANGRA